MKSKKEKGQKKELNFEGLSRGYFRLRWMLSFGTNGIRWNFAFPRVKISSRHQHESAAVPPSTFAKTRLMGPHLPMHAHLRSNYCTVGCTVRTYRLIKHNGRSEQAILVAWARCLCACLPDATSRGGLRRLGTASIERAAKNFFAFSWQQVFPADDLSPEVGAVRWCLPSAEEREREKEGLLIPPSEVTFDPQ